MESPDPGPMCPRCGKPLPPDATEGLCAACLLTAGAESLTRSDVDSALTVSSVDGPAASAWAPQRLAPGQMLGAYRIVRLLGKGGMGEVYEAEHTGNGRRVAVKVLRKRLQDADDRARFLREGQLAASISHPHAVYIFGSEEIGGAPIISMELLPGGTLKDRVHANGPLPPDQAVSAVLQIIAGLDAAHAAGILHRDIKPSNCFVDGNGTVKIGDFGLSISTLARDVHHELSSSGFEGTPPFAPPEQLRGEPLDVRADIYSVGATLYYLLTGRPPFEAVDLRELVAKVTTESPPSPRALRRQVPARLSDIVMRCLAKKPSDRPASHAALSDELRPFAVQDQQGTRPATRLVAGFIDSAITGVIVMVLQLARFDPFTQSAVPAASGIVMGAAASFLYFAILEGFRGASLGKQLMRLQVVGVDGARAPWLRTCLRALVYTFPAAIVALAATVQSGSLVGDVLMPLTLTAIMFSTARRSNLWAGLHDLISGTRVVARHAAPVRLERVTPPDASEHVDRVAASRRYGPFEVVADLGATEQGRVYAGFDPLLRRRVWIHTYNGPQTAVSPARRDVSRVGRLHWLTGQRAGDEAWDAFEAPDGEPLDAVRLQGVPWHVIKRWLTELADELVMAWRDGSLPALKWNHLWIRVDRRLLLLDFRAQPASARQGHEADVPAPQLLSTFAARILQSAQDPAALPLSAREMLVEWKDRGPEAAAALDTLSKTAAPVESIRLRRAVGIAALALPAAMMVAASFAVLPAIERFASSDTAELLSWLELLRNPKHPAADRFNEPGRREATEIYVATRFSKTIEDPSFWAAAGLQSEYFAGLRQTAAEVAAKHRSVTPEAIESARDLIASDIAAAQARAKRESGNMGVVNSIIVLSAFWGGLAVSWILAMVSSVIVPGGLLARLLGLAVVTRDGREIARPHSLVRAVIAWLPALVLFVQLLLAPRIQGWVPVPDSPLTRAGMAIAIMLPGALWTLMRPSRGPHDRLARTWVTAR